MVVYAPATDYIGADSFSYTISDGRGGTATAYVFVLVQPLEQAASMLMPQPIAGGFIIRFAGVAGQAYTLQRAELITGPWTSLGQVSVGPLGIAGYADTNSLPANAFYRAVYP